MQRIAQFWKSGIKGKLVIGCSSLLVILCLSTALCTALGALIAPKESTQQTREESTATQAVADAEPTDVLRPTETPLPTQSSPPTDTPKPAPTPTSTRIPADRTNGFVDCLACAHQHPWLIYLRSEPGRDAGTAVGGLRHADEIEVLDAYWHSGEGRWWYKVTGWDEYTKDVGDAVTGWIPETNVTVGVPEQYPLGTAWIEFAIEIQAGGAGDVVIWDRPRYYNLQGRGIGSMRHGTSVQISDSEWDPDHGIWFYEITGVDYKTKQTITGWLDGIFLVLAPPP